MTPNSPPISDAEHLSALRRALQRAEGFTLLLARVNLPAQQDALATGLKAELAEEVEVQDVVLDGAITDLTALLAEQVRPVAGDARRAVFVHGLEHSLPSAAPRHPLLAVLNLKRELLQRTVPYPLVLWLPEYALRALAEGAPDLWAWRSGVFDFTTPRDETERLWEAERPGGGVVEYGNLTASEKRDRIRTLATLLADYEARDDAGSAGIVDQRLSLLNRLGRLYGALGQQGEALTFYTSSLHLAELHSDRGDIAIPLHQIGVVHQGRGDLGAALDHFRRSLDIAEEIGNRGGIAASLHNIGVVHEERGDLGAALDYYQRSLDIKEEIGNRGGIAASLHQIGRVHQERGDLGAALDHFRRSLDVAEEIGDRIGASRTLFAMGLLERDRDRYPESLNALAQALKVLPTPDLPLANAVMFSLRHLRREWGQESFDVAWRARMGADLPAWLTADAAEEEPE